MRMKCMVGSKIFKRYLFLLVLLFVGALNYNLIIKPSKIVAGGINGLTVIVNYIFRIDSSIFIFLFQVFLLIISSFLLDFYKASSALITCIIYPFFIKITESINIFFISNLNIYLLSIIGGLISGLVTGLICKMNLSVGGTIIISQIINKKFRINISLINFVINIIILFIGKIIFKGDSFIISIIFMVINWIILRIILDNNRQKRFNKK